MIEDRFGIKDEEYWFDPWPNRKVVQRALMQKGEEGLVLGAPASVALSLHADFPAAFIRVAKLTTFAKIPSRESVIIAAMEPNSNQLYARLALPWSPARPAAPAAGNPPAGRDSFSGDDSAMMSEGHTLDLAAWLGLPRARGEYLLSAILRDTVSNRCRMKLADSAGFDDPAVDDFVREYRASKLKPREVFPPAADPLTSYRRQENSPALPDEPGIALSVPRVQLFSSKTRCMVSGSFRLPIQAQRPGAPDLEAGAPANAPVETARVPIALLITGSTDATPQIVNLVIPSYEPVKTAAGRQQAVGHFSFDLCRIARLLTTPQTFFIYAFAGEVMTPAIPCAFVRLPEAEQDEAAA